MAGIPLCHPSAIWAERRYTSGDEIWPTPNQEAKPELPYDPELLILVMRSIKGSGRSMGIFFTGQGIRRLWVRGFKEN
jgi:hypothetical protein